MSLTKADVSCGVEAGAAVLVMVQLWPFHAIHGDEIFGEKEIFVKLPTPLVKLQAPLFFGLLQSLVVVSLPPVQKARDIGWLSGRTYGQPATWLFSARSCYNHASGFPKGSCVACLLLTDEKI